MDIWVVNKLKRIPGQSGRDKWYVTKISGCQYKRDYNSVMTDKLESNSANFIVLIPFTGKYREYADWKDFPYETFTMSTGDYIFLDDPGELDENSIVKRHNDARFRSMEVRTFVKVRKRPGTTFELKVTG